MALTRPKYSSIYDTDWKNSVKLATTADVGDLLASNAQPNSVDGVSLTINDRILVKDQGNTKQNGLYFVRSVGTGSNGWWARTLDANQDAFVTSGLTVDVTTGTVNSNRTYRLTTPDPVYLGNTALTFGLVTAQPGGANTYVQFYDQNNQIGGTAGFTFNKTSNAVTISGNINSGHLLPAANVTYDLGSPTARWRTGYFSANTLDLGGSTISVDPTNGFTFRVSGATSNITLAANGSASFTSISTSGNITVAGFLNTLANVSVGGNLYAGGNIIAAAAQLNGFFDENTTSPGVFIGNAGSGTPSPRIGFFNSATAQNWQIDNYNGTFRWFTPGVTRLSLSPTGNLTVTGALIAGGSGGSSGQVLQSTGTGIQWTAPSAGTQISYGTSNIAVLSSGSNVVISVGGSIIANVGSTGLTVIGGISAGTLTGNGAALTGLPAGYSNVNTATYLVSGTLATAINTSGNILSTGAIHSTLNVNSTTNATGVNTGAVQVVGGMSIAKDLWVTGNVYAGNLMSTVANIVTIQDSLIYLNSSNVYPYSYTIGMYGHYIGGPANAYVHTGIVKQPNDNTWWFISNIAEPNPATANINVYDSNRILDNIQAGNINLTGNIIAATHIGSNVFVNGNVTAAYVIGNGSQLTGLPAGYSNVNLLSYLVSGVAGAIIPSVNNTYTLGSASNQWTTIYGAAVTAKYADLAEIYTSDQQYLAGTVVIFGGTEEVTQSSTSHDTRIAGVVSTDPAYLMNSTETGVPVALQGRVPCRVLGPINKGDRVVASHIPGVAQALDSLHYQPGCIIGKALESFDEAGVRTIEVVVGRV